MSQFIHVPPSSDGSNPETIIIEPPKNPKVLPTDVNIFPLSNFVAFPHMILPVVVPKGKLQDLIHKNSGTEYIGFLARKSGQGDDPKPSELYDIGVCARILRVLRLPEGSTSIIVQTLKRFKIENFSASVPIIKAHVVYLEETKKDEKRLQALTTTAQGLLQEIIQLSPTLSEEFSLAALNVDGPSKLSDFIAAHLKRIDMKARQQLLETTLIDDRLERCIYHITQELEILRLGQKIQGEIQSKITSSQRDYFLREQLKAIRKELGDEKADESGGDLKKLKDKLDAAKLPEEARTKADDELRRLSLIPSESSEYSVTRNYLEWLATLPWNTTTDDISDLKGAYKVLERDHHGLKDVKDRILEFLAVKQLKKDLSGSIICFVGPPGVGKTSLGKSIAESLGRKFFRLSLGGMRDEAEIKGHRRTYVGSMPGRLIQALKRVNSKNPVILLDEIDKLGSDWRGDPAAALLEVLDPEQNKNFLDHYLDVAFDLSKVMFICTANTLDTIPTPLRDRMEIIEISGYLESEKVAIAQKYLFPKKLKEAGLEAKYLKVNADAFHDMVHFYTRESGVRNLEREIEKLCRKVATQVAKGKKTTVAVTPKNIPHFLGVHRFTPESMIPNKPGVVMGLAWTSVGGEVLYIEASKMPGSKNLNLTGKLGETMTESAKIALSYMRSVADQYKIDLKDFDKTDIHIHFPAGAIRKDGPSAGITIVTALFSLFKNQPVKKNIAMTGEISLVGQVLPIGGLKQKLIAAKQYNCKEVVIPFENKKDLTEIPKEVKSGLKFYFAKTYDDVFKAVFKK